MKCTFSLIEKTFPQRVRIVSVERLKATIQSRSGQGASTVLHSYCRTGFETQFTTYIGAYSIPKGTGFETQKTHAAFLCRLRSSLRGLRHKTVRGSGHQCSVVRGTELTGFETPLLRGLKHRRGTPSVVWSTKLLSNLFNAAANSIGNLCINNFLKLINTQLIRGDVFLLGFRGAYL